MKFGIGVYERIGRNDDGGPVEGAPAEGGTTPPGAILIPPETATVKGAPGAAGAKPPTGAAAVTPADGVSCGA
jgi:hypothetical protein